MCNAIFFVVSKIFLFIRHEEQFFKYNGLVKKALKSLNFSNLYKLFIFNENKKNINVCLVNIICQVNHFFFLLLLFFCITFLI